MANEQTNRIFAQIIAGMANRPASISQPPVKNQDIASQIIRNSGLNWDKVASKQNAKPADHPSIFSRVLDILSRPNYAVANAARSVLTGSSGTNPLEEAFQGFTGKEKTRFNDVLQELGVKNKLAAGIGGFALDVGLDPTTYVGAGALKGAARAVGIKVAEKPALSAAMLSAKEAHPEFSLKPIGQQFAETGAPAGATVLTYSHDIPGLIKKVKAQPRAKGAGRQFISAKTQIDEFPLNITKPKPSIIPEATPAELVTAQRTASSYIGKYRLSKDIHLTPRQQSLMYENFLKKTGNDATRASAMLKAAEVYMESKGVGFKLWEGSRASLTHVIDELGGPQNLTADLLKQYRQGKVSSPELLQAVETLRARSAMRDAPIVNQELRNATQQSAMADVSMAPARARELKDGLLPPKLDISPASMDIAKLLFQDMRTATEGTLQTALDKNVKYLHLAVGGNQRAITNVTEAVNRAKENVMGVRLKDLSKEQQESKGVLGTIGMSLSAMWKNPNLRHLDRQYMLSAHDAASMRANDFNGHLKGHTQEQINSSVKMAQGRLPGWEDDPLAKYVVDTVENMFGSSGLRAEAESVALRAGIPMKELNKKLNVALPKDMKGLRFKQGLIKDPVTGATRDYRGALWPHSWEIMDMGERPQDVIFAMQTAVEDTTRWYSLLDDVAGRFGSKFPTQDFRYKVEDVPRLSGYYFDKQIASELAQMNKNMERIFYRKSDIERVLDKALSVWKRSVTIYVPSHHVRNLIGDVYLAFLGGVTNPAVYAESARVLKTYRQYYKGAHINDLFERGAVQKVMDKPGRVVLHTKAGVPITAEQLFVAAHNYGLMLPSRDIEDIFGDVVLKRWRPLGGHAYNVATKTSELREHYAIMAHFIHAMKKQGGKDVEKMFERASAEVRKWHPNGTDLTEFERRTLRRLIPFYSWNRKAIPLMIESLLFNPGRVALYPKGMTALQTALGIDDVGWDNMPVDQAWPAWMKAEGIGPLGQSGREGILGFLGNLGRQKAGPTGEPISAPTAIGTQLLPLSSPFGELLSDPGTFISSSVTPMLTVPLDIMRGQSDIGPAFQEDPTRYTAEQLGIVGPLYRILNRPGAKTGKGDFPAHIPGTPIPIDIQALLNNLTAAGIQGTGAYQPAARKRNR